MPLIARRSTDALPLLSSRKDLARTAVLERLDELHWPRMSPRARRQLERTIQRTIDRNRHLLEQSSRRARQTSQELAHRAPWHAPTLTERVIDVTAQLVAPAPGEPSPLATIGGAAQEAVHDAVQGAVQGAQETVQGAVVAVTDTVAGEGRTWFPFSSSSSHVSLWSSHSSYSALSAYSFASVGSALSVLSAGSILSIGSTGSILSIGSIGSILSIGSAGSVLSIGGAGSASADGAGGAGVGAAPNAALLRTTARLLQLAATAAGATAVLAAALTD